MELLRDDRGRWSRRCLAAAALLSCAGCILIDAFGTGARELVFSHRIHVVEEGLACINCHEDAEAAGEPGMPVLDGCSVCHEVLDEEKPPERRIETLFAGDGSFRAARVSALADELVFEHLAHVRAVDDCGACHTGIDRNQAVGTAQAVDMDACVACHRKRSVSSDCSTCHRVITEEWVPPSHELDWTYRHGSVCRRADADSIDRCETCHRESSCVQCHQVELPRDHDVHWRLRGHGITARMDRQGCATCHEPVSCDRCHAEARPLNHRGTWGGMRSSHCVSCHFPLQASGCGTCHASAPSHALGPPKPDWHDAAFDCRQCHGQATLPLTHVDNGSNCNACHP